MREIKFRAWDNDNQRMVDNAIVFYPHFEKRQINASAIYMQYTGQTNNQNIEICEGDIISEKWKCEVYKNKDNAFMVKFHYNPKVNKPKLLSKYLSGRNRASGYTLHEDDYIIGTIYENPELLEQ